VDEKGKCLVGDFGVTVTPRASRLCDLTAFMRARRGRIARLPRQVRVELSRCWPGDELGKHLLGRLKGHPDAKPVRRDCLGGRECVRLSRIDAYLPPLTHRKNGKRRSQLSDYENGRPIGRRTMRRHFMVNMLNPGGASARLAYP